ncbi:hypothetical protein BV898_10627 [Hypsibius exemplaris]|uniref:Uncharacterized protein n=1 Tax=Hypsibius exemplaris TaxID=2072580 RepID=A0A1W0WJ59_HYPEX|nr:hypothetical protein BV898_10627 [Hypsibius exemplaris]
MHVLQYEVRIARATANVAILQRGNGERITATLEYMLRCAEEAMILKQINDIEMEHHALDKYVNWLHKTAQVDIKTLLRKLKWSRLRHHYLEIRRTLEQDVRKAAASFI